MQLEAYYTINNTYVGPKPLLSTPIYTQNKALSKFLLIEWGFHIWNINITSLHTQQKLLGEFKHILGIFLTNMELKEMNF